MKRKLLKEELEVVRFLAAFRLIPPDQRKLLLQDFDKTFLPNALEYAREYARDSSSEGLENVISKAAKLAVALWIHSLDIDIKKQSRFLEYVFNVNQIDKIPTGPISDFEVARLVRKFESKCRFFEQLMWDLLERRALEDTVHYNTEIRVPVSVSINGASDEVEIAMHDDALRFFINFRSWTGIDNCRFRNCGEYFYRTRKGQKYCDSNCRNAEASQRCYADPKKRSKILRKKRKAYQEKRIER